MDWIRACSLQDIPVLGSRRVQRRAGLDVALFRTGDDEVFALLDRCPHKGGPLSMGLVFGHSVACPLHNWTLGLADGCAKEPDEGCTPAFQVKQEGGEVFLLQSELDTLALELAAPLAGPRIPIEVA